MTHLPRSILRAGDFVSDQIIALSPTLLATASFSGGIILLVSGAMPVMPHRIAWLTNMLPLPVMELSHFFASLVGAALLVLARGLHRRLDAAYVATASLLVLGIVLSLIKGFDYEEAALLALMLLALLPCRAQFYRKTSLFHERFGGGWFLAVFFTVVGCIGLGLFAYKHIEYRDELWWQFSMYGDGPRFLRASVGVTALVIWLSIADLLKPARHDPPPADPAMLDRLTPIIRDFPKTYASLALLGDKAILENAAKTAFLMYGVQGSSWIALGDPVGPATEVAGLVQRFREACDRFHGSPVFYSIGKENLTAYLDAGLTLIKIGEEARVSLAAYSLEGGDNRELRYTHRHLGKEGCSLEIVTPEQIPQHLAILRTISDAWLSSKKTREKRFSLGFFDDNYLRRCSVALVRRNGKPVAFANFRTAGKKEEIALDLMRYGPEAPSGIMDYLFIEMILWSKQQGYQWFNLGTAPLSGFERRSFAPAWQRVGAFIYSHGEHFYNFQGLRHYKEKFNPVWEPDYLAYPGGLGLPQALLDVTALISGGWRGIMTK